MHPVLLFWCQVDPAKTSLTGYTEKSVPESAKTTFTEVELTPGDSNLLWGATKMKGPTELPVEEGRRMEVLKVRSQGWIEQGAGEAYLPSLGHQTRSSNMSVH
jgi:hypothetical protein